MDNIGNIRVLAKVIHVIVPNLLLSEYSLLISLILIRGITAKITIAIYWQALRLWLKRVPFLGHGGEGQPQKK